MAMTRKQIADWLIKFGDDDEIAIDDGGLTLINISYSPEIYPGINSGIPYLEVGGVPQDEEE